MYDGLELFEGLQPVVEDRSKESGRIVLCVGGYLNSHAQPETISPSSLASGDAPLAALKHHSSQPVTSPRDVLAHNLPITLLRGELSNNVPASRYAFQVVECMFMLCASNGQACSRLLLAWHAGRSPCDRSSRTRNSRRRGFYVATSRDLMSSTALCFSGSCKRLSCLGANQRLKMRTQRRCAI